MRYVLFIFSLMLTQQVFYTEASKPISNEDIRDAILSLLHFMKNNDAKLERHELRERNLGEQFKKVLLNIEQRQKKACDIKGTVTRLDERLANVETILLQNDERERIQLQKTTNAIEKINDSMQSWMAQMEKVIKESSKKEPELPQIEALLKKDLSTLRSEILWKIDHVLTKDEHMLADTDKILKKVDKLNNDINKLQEDNKDIKHFNEKSARNFDQVQGKLNTSEKLLDKYETHLAEFNNRIMPLEVQVQSAKVETNWQPNFLTAMESHQSQLRNLSDNIKNIETKMSTIPDLSKFTTVQNSTMRTLQEMRHEIDSKTDENAFKLNARLTEFEKKLNENQVELSKAVTDIGKVSEHGLLDIAQSNEIIIKEIQSVPKLEKVMVQTADNVIDTKRRVEYGVHEILLQVGDLVKIQGKEMNATLNSRFDQIEQTILDDETGALANLSSKIQEEMSQVWRQIGNMHQELTASTLALNKLKEQTTTYVNDTMSTMGNMESKVGQITTRMTEIDDNLNYMLGRLSLVSQEFNQIREGLGKELDNIRNGFRTVQDKLTDKGPGPHVIENPKS